MGDGKSRVFLGHYSDPFWHHLGASECRGEEDGPSWGWCLIGGVRG